MKHKRRFILLTLILIGIQSDLYSQDPNFYIFLNFGQSNMEGSAPIEPHDTLMVDERFMVMEALDCPNLNRKKGEWYVAKPPLSRCNTGLSPTDYFGRTLIAGLPKEIKVGVINVSVGGCKIELFDKNNYEAYVKTAPEWLKAKVREYEGNPYARLVELARLAQRDGVIKGILLHQGESNTGDEEWPRKVKEVYNNLLADLGLENQDIPILAGEMVSKEEGGRCASMNSIIARLPQAIPDAHIISSEDCAALDDGLHFSSDGYRKLGMRYGKKMLDLLGYGSNSVGLK